MKKHTVIGILFLLIIVVYSITVSHAQSATLARRPFGAQVVLAQLPAITCLAQYGAISLRPVVPMVPSPYFIRSTTKHVSTGSWLLGWYNPVPNVSTCSAAESTPVPAFEITY
ncbi:hypothetical protein IT401_02475 [Candidatus Nomurabacteria bacterium]|nr:hypothetical protein [Candidatus Nomurabacteria bacterium]